MAPSRKSQKPKAMAAAPSPTPQSKKRLEVQTRENHAELFKHFEKLLCYREALYHPDTKQKLFIVNAGICLNRNCQWDKNHHMVKVAMPRSSREQFRQSIPFEFIGKRVVCFIHYPFNLQIHYLTTGSFPADAKMLQNVPTSKTTGPEHAPGALNKDNSWVSRIYFYNNRYSSNLKLSLQSTRTATKI